MTSSQLPLSRVMMDSSLLRLGPGSLCRIWRLPLQEGAELVYWRSTITDVLDIPLQDDSDYVHFSFNSHLQGYAASYFDGWAGGREFAVKEGVGTISYGPGRCGHYRQQGQLNNITVMVRPEVLYRWMSDNDRDLATSLTSSACFLHGQHGAELQAAAHLLARSMSCEDTPVRHPLWMQAQALLLVSLFLEACGQPLTGSRPDTAQRMTKVRDQLLADLSCPPNLLALAQNAGLSVPTLTRAYRRQYGRSIYDHFQQERMHQAYARLHGGQLSVARVAVDLGYSNTSHFAAAFHKQFGINPSQLKNMALFAKPPGTAPVQTAHPAAAGAA